MNATDVERLALLTWHDLEMRAGLVTRDRQARPAGGPKRAREPCGELKPSLAAARQANLAIVSPRQLTVRG